MASEKRIYQTLEPWARTRLNPRFCDLFDRVIQYVPPIEQSTEWDERLRFASSGYEGLASDAVEVEIIDIKRVDYWVRVYRRKDRERGKLYPVLVYAHGGK
jgi:dipeptidyl aminopeptidase/acylaminoacyl peptidase